MARIIRKADEDLEEMLKELKVGQTVLDSETGYDITKTLTGYIWKNEYIGMVYEPAPKEEKPKTEKAGEAKAEPKKIK